MAVDNIIGHHIFSRPNPGVLQIFTDNIALGLYMAFGIALHAKYYLHIATGLQLSALNQAVYNNISGGLYRKSISDTAADIQVTDDIQIADGNIYIPRNF